MLDRSQRVRFRDGYGAVIVFQQGHRAAKQVDRDVERRAGIIDRVDPRSAEQTVVAGTAVKRIVARAAGNRIRRATARKKVGPVAALQDFFRSTPGNRIVAVTTDEILDAFDRVGTDTGRDRRTGRGIDRHGCGNARVIQRIKPASAINGVVARVEGRKEAVFAIATRKRVVAAAAAQRVGASAAGHGVVCETADHRIDVDQGIDADPATDGKIPTQIDGDRRRYRRIIDSIAAGQGAHGRTAGIVRIVATEKFVVVPVFRTDKNVVARTAKMQIVTDATIQSVVARIADQLIIAPATQERVVPASAEQQIRVVAAVEEIIVGITAQRIHAVTA